MAYAYAGETASGVPAKQNDGLLPYPFDNTTSLLKCRDYTPPHYRHPSTLPAGIINIGSVANKLRNIKYEYTLGMVLYYLKKSCYPSST